MRGWKPPVMQTEAEKRAAEMAMRKAPKVVAPEAAHTKIPLPQDRPLTSEHYSTAFRVRLEEGVHYPGKGDSIHFREANKQLYEKLTLNKGFATQMETLYPGITKAVTPGPRGGFSKDAPLDLTWHHNAYNPGVLELVPYAHHTSKGPVSANLHPGRKGGQEIWGKGRKKETS